MNEFLIYSFRSRTQVMHFSRILRSAGIFHEIVSTPRQVSVGCGLSVRVGTGDRAQATSLMNRARLDGFVYTVREENGILRILSQNPR